MIILETKKDIYEIFKTKRDSFIIYIITLC